MEIVSPRMMRALAAGAGVLLWASGTAWGHPLQGLWLIQEGNATVRFERYRGALSGRVVWVRDSLDSQRQLRRDRKNPDPALRDRVMRDLVIVTDLATTSPDSTQWKARVYDPRSGHTYSARLTLEGPDRLKLRGYVVIPLLGRTTRWTRVKAL